MSVHDLNRCQMHVETCLVTFNNAFPLFNLLLACDLCAAVTKEPLSRPLVWTNIVHIHSIPNTVSVIKKRARGERDHCRDSGNGASTHIGCHFLFYAFSELPKPRSLLVAAIMLNGASRQYFIKRYWRKAETAQVISPVATSEHNVNKERKNDAQESAQRKTKVMRKRSVR